MADSYFFCMYDTSAHMTFVPVVFSFSTTRGKRTTGRRRRAVKHDGDEQMEAMDVMEEGLDSLVMEQPGDGDAGECGRLGSGGGTWRWRHW